MTQQFLNQAVVLDNQDPLMLGRIRARVLTKNYLDIVSSFDDPPWNEEKDKWTARDPFIFTPLLPFFIYQVPKISELIYTIYYNPDVDFQNQFYVQATFSTPMASPFEYYVGAQKMTGIGVQFTDPRAIKNQDGTYKNDIPKGVFPEPGDNAILGRGSADLIVKENEVLLRAGKYVGELKQNQPPVGNDKSAFLQLNKFPGTKVKQGTSIVTRLFEETMMTQFLIEWNIVNPENQENQLSGAVYLYKLKPDTRVNTKEISPESDIEDLKGLIYSKSFSSFSPDDVVNFINNFIQTCNDNVQIDGRMVLPITEKFPMYYRPTKFIYSLLNSDPFFFTNNTPSISATKNINYIFSKVKLNQETVNKGYGLIYARNKTGVPFAIKRSQVTKFGYSQNPTTYASLGADKVFLLSQQATPIGTADTINFSGILYGIPNEKYVDEFLPKTNSMVRGETLLELLNLVVRFLVSHTHSYPGKPPSKKSYDGVEISSIEKKLAEAPTQILNSNIRLN